MLAPQNFEELESEIFVSIGKEFEDLWLNLLRQKTKLAAFLISRNPYNQPLRDRIAIATMGIPLDYVERFLRENETDRIRKLVRAFCRKISMEFVDYSYTILRSNRLWAPRYWEYPWAITNTQPRKGMQILDTGSGWSIFPTYLAKVGFLVTAVDTDVTQMTCVSPFLARLASAEVHYEVGDVVNLDFPDDTFDRVYCISVLEHLEEETRNGKPFNAHKRNLDVIAIREMLRVLKPGGFLAITLDWSEQPNNLRSYRFDDITARLVKPFRSYLVSEATPRIQWSSYWPRLVRLWQDRFPFDTEEEALGEAGAAMGILLRKPS